MTVRAKAAFLKELINPNITGIHVANHMSGELYLQVFIGKQQKQVFIPPSPPDHPRTVDLLQIAPAIVWKTCRSLHQAIVNNDVTVTVQRKP
jgi:hypothetical protein